MKRCGNNDIAVSIQALAPCLSFRLRNDLDRFTIQQQSSSSAGSPSATGIVSGRGLLHCTWRGHPPTKIFLNNFFF